MCIIQGYTEGVNDTLILAFPTVDKRSQVTVYSNKVQLRDQRPVGHPDLEAFFPGYTQQFLAPQAGAAMILPVPRGAEAFEMIDTSDCSDLFEQIDGCFPVSPKLKSSRGFETYANSYLEVKSCGSYKYSLLPSLAAFDQVDPSVFRLDSEVKGLLQSAYPASFAFLVCKIEESKKFHPVAYKHPLPSDGQLFIPTLHFHQGHHDQNHPDWDHRIYVVGNQNLGLGATSADKLRELGCFREVMPPVRADTFRRLKIQGSFPNRDLRVPVAG